MLKLWLVINIQNQFWKGGNLLVEPKEVLLLTYVKRNKFHAFCNFCDSWVIHSAMFFRVDLKGCTFTLTVIVGALIKNMAIHIYCLSC